MPAAGSGVRLGANQPKALIEIAGSALFVHALKPFMECRELAETVIAAPTGYEDEFRRIVEREFPQKAIRVVTGGATRQESVLRALNKLTADTDAVLIHDAARVLVTPDLVRRVLNALCNDAVAVVPGIPVADTVKRYTGEPAVVTETVDRRQLTAVQTPQAILYKIAVDVYRRAEVSGYLGTDDVSLVEHFQAGTVRLVEGDSRNFKITTREDLERARTLLEQPRR